MFMINIPRRKVYETMLEFEEHLLEIQVLIRNENNFKKYKNQYKQSYPKIIEKYKKILALLILFFENKKYEKEGEFEADVDYYINQEKETLNYLQKSKNLTKEFKNIINSLEEKFNENKEIKDLKQGEDLFFYLDKFNSNIPKILEIRRDQIS